MSSLSSSFFLCSHSARTETRILSSVDLVASLVYVILGGLLSYFVVSHPDVVREFVREEAGGDADLGKLLEYGRVKQGIVLAMFIVRPIVSLVIAALLLIGAHRRNYVLVRVLFIVLVLFIVIDLILLVPRTIYTSNGKLYVIVYLVNFVWVVYEVRAVYILMTELREVWEKEHLPPKDEEGAPAEEPQTAEDGGGGEEKGEDKDEAVVVE